LLVILSDASLRLEKLSKHTYTQRKLIKKVDTRKFGEMPCVALEMFSMG